MKIVHASPLLAYQGHFAHEAWTKSVAMAEAGVTVTILGFPETLPELPEHPRVRYASVQDGWSAAKKARIQAMRQTWGNWWLFLVEIWWVQWHALRRAARERADVVYFSETEPWLLIPALLAAKLLGRRTPVVGFIPYTFFHSESAKRYKQSLNTTTLVRGRINYWAARWLPLGMDIVCDGEPARHYLFRYRMDRTHVIHEGFEKPTRIWTRAEARACLGLPAGRRIALLFGVASFAKGSDLLMQAIATLPAEFDICLVGKVGGEHQSDWGADRYRSTAWETHLHVVSRFVTEEEKGLYFSACDAVVVPYRYGFMMTSGQVRNAVTYGKALIACDQFEIGRYTREFGLGLLFEPEDVAALRQALISFAGRPDAWFDEVAARCRALAEEESMLNMGRRYRELFEAVIAKTLGLNFGGTTSVSSENWEEREERTGQLVLRSEALLRRVASPSLQQAKRMRNDSQTRPSAGDNYER